MTPTALRAPLRCPELGRGCYQSLTLEPSRSLYLQEGRMEPRVQGRHRAGQEREEGLRQMQAADGGPALTTWRTDRLPSAVNLSSLEFAGSPGLEPGLQKEVGLFRGVRQPPACPPGGALPTQRGARLAGRGSSPEGLPEIKAQPRVSDASPGACSFFALRFSKRACQGGSMGGLPLGLWSSRPPPSEDSRSILAEGRTSPGHQLLTLGGPR